MGWSCSTLYSQQQACLDVRPWVLQLSIRIHPKQDPQAAGKTAGLLLQQVGLGLPFKAWGRHTETFPVYRHSFGGLWWKRERNIHPFQAHMKNNCRRHNVYLPSRVLFFVRCSSWSPWRRCATPADSPAAWRGVQRSCVCTYLDPSPAHLPLPQTLREHLSAVTGESFQLHINDSPTPPGAACYFLVGQNLFTSPFF